MQQYHIISAATIEDLCVEVNQFGRNAGFRVEIIGQPFVFGDKVCQAV